MRIGVFLIVVLGLAAAGVIGGLHSFNYFNMIEREFSGRCTPVAGITGPEDIQIDAKRRLAFISSLDRRAADARGAIHVFDLNDPLAAGGWRDRTNGAPEVFRPLGFDYFEDGEVRRLFVVNEANAAIELFDVGEDGDLKHLETFSERRVNSPNNVVAAGRRSFYVTNDVKPGRETALGDLHFLFRTGSGQVLYMDGAIWRIAAEGLRFANGIDLSPDGRRLYVAETAGGALRIFDRDPTSGSLTPLKTIKLDAAPDNVTVDNAGDIWIAALPKPLAVPRLAKDTEAVAPSQVIRIGGDGNPQTVYRDNGKEISAATVGAHLDDLLLIGALYEQKFLICDLPQSVVPAKTTS